MSIQVNKDAVGQDIATIAPMTRLGHVHYTTADLEGQIAFYQTVLGFKLHWREDDSAGLGGGGEDLLRLTERTDAPHVRGTTGLYHTAFLLPTRWDLAHTLRRIAETRTPIQGMTDHATHLAIYLPDIENNGIELAWDFPQAQWPKTIEEMMMRQRGLSPQTVFQALADNPAEWEGLNQAAKVGHVHLHVAHLAPTTHFYHEVLGMEIPFNLGDSAVFFAAGGYHHHIGTNIWQGIGAPPPPKEAVGLRYYTVILPTETDLEQAVKNLTAAKIMPEETERGFFVDDPAQNRLLLTTHTE